MMSPAGRILSLSALLVGSAVAQSATSILDSLSTSCKAAATGLLSSQFGTCADMNDLLGVVTASGSIVTPLNTWATNLCKQGPCPDTVVQASASSIDTNCTTDLQNGNIAAIVLQTITTNFDDVKNMVCLQSSSNSTSCLTNFLTNVQTVEGTLTVSVLEQLASASGIQGVLEKLPQSDVCTDCNSAILNQVSGTQILNSSEITPLKQAAQQECGSSFGTSMPSDVKEATSPAARTTFSIAVVGLAGLAFAF